MSETDKEPDTTPRPQEPTEPADPQVTGSPTAPPAGQPDEDED